MTNPAGARRDFDQLERRRFEAIRLLEEGANQTEVARILGVARQTVARWAKQYRGSGPRGLAKAGRAGRRPRLLPEDKVRLQELLAAGPGPSRDPSAWTCSRVARLIRREFGITYHEGHVWKLLVSLGWKTQRAKPAAAEVQEAAVAGTQLEPAAAAMAPIRPVFPGHPAEPARLVYRQRFVEMPSAPPDLQGIARAAG